VPKKTPDETERNFTSFDVIILSILQRGKEAPIDEDANVHVCVRSNVKFREIFTNIREKPRLIRVAIL
jgi:hypothetical protein